MTKRPAKPAAKARPTIVQAPLARSTRETLAVAPDGYAEWMLELKARVHEARQRAARAVNNELVGLYWRIGRDILARQQTHGWGAKIVDRISADLKTEFPESEGFSPRNLKYMRAFAVAWPDEDFVQGVLAQLPWYTHLALLEKLHTPEERRWYAQKAIEHGWSRNVLVLQIDARAMKRTGAALTNFQARLPEPHSDLARESLKDPYRLDFLGLGEDAQERVVEAALVQHITKFLLELGAGFAFVGRQRVLDVSGDEFFIDLLFYHLRLRRYVVVELKSGKFKPEHLGQLGFYCTAIDAQVKAPDDQPTIGLLLCKNRNELVAEYALRTTSVPLGIADYQLIESLPKELDGNLPSIARIEEELRGEPTPPATRPTTKKSAKQRVRSQAPQRSARDR
jgi:predicted nuclease of restriction endonuclease-like (RecB) superfamily